MRFVFGLLSVLVLFGSALATEPLDLARAKRIALERNPLLQAARAQVEAARSGVAAARARFLPRIDLRGIYQRSDSPVRVFSSKLAQQHFEARDFELDRLNHPSPRTDLVTEIVITQPLFNRGEEIVGYREAKIREELALLAERGARQRVLYETEAAFLEWLLARKRVEVVSAALATARANERVVRARVEAGTALRSDLLQARVFVSSLERELLGARNEARVARSRLNTVLGVPLETEWEPEEVEIDLGASEQTLAYWTEQALAHRPDLLAEEARLRLAREEVNRARWRFAPALNLKGIYEYHASDLGGVSGDAYTFLAQADLNLFRGLGDRAQLAQARARELAQSEALRHLRQQVRHEVERAFLSLQTARKQVRVTREAVDEAKEGLRIVERRYREGLTIIVELLDAQTALKRARLEHLEALYRYRLAWTELRFRSGRLGEGER